MLPYKGDSEFPQVVLEVYTALKAFCSDRPDHDLVYSSHACVNNDLLSVYISWTQITDTEDERLDEDKFLKIADPRASAVQSEIANSFRKMVNATTQRISKRPTANEVDSFTNTHSAQTKSLHSTGIGSLGLLITLHCY